MIIRHSLSILEQLSEIENLISKVERLMEENAIEVDKEILLKKLMKNREAMNASRHNEKN